MQRCSFRHGVEVRARHELMAALALSEAQISKLIQLDSEFPKPTSIDGDLEFYSMAEIDWWHFIRTRSGIYRLLAQP